MRGHRRARCQAEIPCPNKRDRRLVGNGAWRRFWRSHKSLAHFDHLLLTLLSGLQPVLRCLFNLMQL